MRQHKINEMGHNYDFLRCGTARNLVQLDFARLCHGVKFGEKFLQVFKNFDKKSASNLAPVTKGVCFETKFIRFGFRRPRLRQEG